VVRMYAFEVLRIGPASRTRSETEDSPSLVGPGHLVRSEIELPASHMADALGLDQEAITLPDLFIRGCALDRGGHQRGRRLQQIHLHMIPNPLGAAIVEAESTPEGSFDEDGYGQHREGMGLLEPSARFALHP